jgi:hypothetical protein
MGLFVGYENDGTTYRMTGYVMPRRDPSSYTSCKDDRYSLENYENDVFGVFLYF